MKLIYIDESGNTGTRTDDINQPYHLLAALIIDDINVRQIENDVRMLGFKHFDIRSQNTDFEFHGYEIHKGKGVYFSKVKVEKRIEIMNELLYIVKNHNLQIVYTLINKTTTQAKLHPHQLAFLYLVEGIENYLSKKNSLGLLIADENDDIEQRLIDDLERFKNLDVKFGYRAIKAEHIIDSVHFVKSNNNHLIQLADIVAYVLLRGRRTHDESALIYEKQGGEPSIGNFDGWVQRNASLKQKTELRHKEILTYRSFISTEIQ